MKGKDEFIERCCGTCSFYIPAKPMSYSDYKNRVRTAYCRLSNKDALPIQGKGCLGWKQVEPAEIEKRQSTYDNREGKCEKPC